MDTETMVNSMAEQHFFSILHKPTGIKTLQKQYRDVYSKWEYVYLEKKCLAASSGRRVFFVGHFQELISSLSSLTLIFSNQRE